MSAIDDRYESARDARVQAEALERLRIVDDVRLALERIMDGASTLDAEAFLDHLDDRGRRVS